MNPGLDIRIGTLVNAANNSPVYIKQIMPYGFESFSLTFWQTLGDVDFPRLASEVKEVIADADVKISSLAMFGNPLERTPKDVESLRGWEHLIDCAHLFGADIVAGFAGRLPGEPIEANSDGVG